MKSRSPPKCARLPRPGGRRSTGRATRTWLVRSLRERIFRTWLVHQLPERCVRRLTPQIRKRTLRLTGKSDHADVGRFAASRRNDLLYALIDVYEALSILAGRQGPYGTVLPGACSKTHPNSKRLAQYLRACAGLSSGQVSNVKRYCHGNRYG